MNRVIEDELKELGSRLAGMPRRNPFALPQPEYFAGLPAALTAVAIRDLADDPTLELPIGMPFLVPDNYFETLPESLLTGSKTFGDETKAGPFAVPENYISTLPTQLLEAAKASDEINPGSTARPFPLFRRSMPWIAAAAVLSAVWFGVGRDTATPSAELRAETALAKLDSDSIGAYLERHVDEFDAETLETSLAGTQVTDFRKVVSGLRNDEIENYLNDAGTGSGAFDDM